MNYFDIIDNREVIVKMKIGYVRVSTVDQNEERQVESLKIKNLDKWFIEKVSGKNLNRPKLNEMLEFVREGDSIYISDFSRLARSTKDLLDIVELLESKKVNLISLKENLDTSTSTGKLMLTMIGAINEFERMNLLERQKEGIAIAKTKGMYKGRKKIDFPENWEEVYERYRIRSINGTQAMEELCLKKTTFYNLKKEWEKEKYGI